MGRQGDYSKREKKKSGKNPKAIAPISLTAPPAEVEVIRKKRKPREDEEE